MGMSTNAMLAYGYNLGGDDLGWNVQQVDADGLLKVDWPALDDDGFQEAARQVLLASVGFTETDWRADGYFDRQRAAEARIGVKIDSHCSGDYPGWFLATRIITVYRGDVSAVDFAALNAQAASENWNGRLAKALEALGLTPTAEHPQWLLASYWG